MHGSELTDRLAPSYPELLPFLWVLQTPAAPSCLRASHVRLPHGRCAPSPGICQGFSYPGQVLLSFRCSGCCSSAPLPPLFCLTYKYWGARGSLHPSLPSCDSLTEQAHLDRNSTSELRTPMFHFCSRLSLARGLLNPTMYLAMPTWPPTETGPNQTLDSLPPGPASPAPPSQDTVHRAPAVPAPHLGPAPLLLSSSTFVTSPTWTLPPDASAVSGAHHDQPRSHHHLPPAWYHSW